MNHTNDLFSGISPLPSPPLPLPFGARPTPIVPPSGLGGTTTLSADMPLPTHHDAFQYQIMVSNAGGLG